MSTNRQSRRRSSILPAATAPLLELLESRTMLCAFDIHDDPMEYLTRHFSAGDDLTALDHLANAAPGPESGGPEAVDILWVNRGVTSGADNDRFDDVFGANADAARAVVDSVIEAWERVITSFNYGLGFPDVYGLTVKMDSAGTSLGASANPTTLLFGKPVEGAITMGRGLDTNGDRVGDGGGWFIDPTPDDHSEFLGTITNAYAGNATPGGPAAGLSDFYTVVAAEMTHTMGLTNLAGSMFQTSGMLTNTGIPDTAEGGGVGTFRTFVGPSISHLMTSNNAGAGGTDFGVAIHSAGPGVNVLSGGQTFIGAEDTGNAVYETGRRYLVPDTMRLILDDSYAFDTVNPDTFGTMYSVLNETTGQVTVRGGAGTSDDVITVYTVNNLVVVSVDVGSDVAGTGPFPGAGNLGAFVTTYDAADVNSILIEAGAGDDDIFINSTEAFVTVNGGSGDDFISVGGGDIDTNLTANVSVIGGSGTDRLWLDDTNDGPGGDDYYITISRVEKNNDTRRVYYEEMEIFTLLGSPQSSTYDVSFLPAGLSPSIFAGTGDDTFIIGGGDIDSRLDSDLTLWGGGGHDLVIFDDTIDLAGSDLYELTSNRLTKSPLGSNRSIEFNGMQELVVNGSDQNSTWNILSVASGLPATLNGGSGNDTFNVATGDLDVDIKSNMTINGGAGTDVINFNDSADGTAADEYTVTQLAFSKNAREFRYGTVEAINLTGSPGPDTFNLNGSPSGTVITLSSGDGNDTFNLGSGDLGTVLTGFVLQGQGGTDALVINDTTDTLEDTYTLTSSTFSKTFPAGNSRQFAQYAGMESLLLDANPANNVINVRSTHSNTPVLVRGNAGDDTINIGESGSVIGILGAITVNGGDGNDRLNYNDGAHPDAATYTVATNSVLRAGTSNVNPNNIEMLRVNAGTAGDTVNVFTSLPDRSITINGNGGDDIVRVGLGNWDGGVQGPVSVIGAAGDDLLVIDDSLGTGAVNYDVTSTMTTSSSPAAGAVSYSEIERYRLEANDDANNIRVNSTFDGEVSIRGNDGADNIDVLDTFPGRVVTVDGGPGLDQMRVNGDNVGTAAVQFGQTQDFSSLLIGDGGTATLVAGGDKVIVTQGLGFAGSGTLDLTDNSMIVDYTGASPISGIIAILIAAYNGGAWNGPGITSSTAAAGTSTGVGYAEATEIFNTFPATFEGQSVDNTSILLKHTCYGDTNLDDTVNLADFNRLAANFGASPRRWAQGDSDFNGIINLADFNRLAGNFGQSALAFGPDAAHGEDEALTLFDGLPL